MTKLKVPVRAWLCQFRLYIVKYYTKLYYFNIFLCAEKTQMVRQLDHRAGCARTARRDLAFNNAHVVENAAANWRRRGQT